MPITIIMGDCNYLKRVNDAYGHEYGDLLLKRVGRVIRENLPPESVALRMGGDEFLIACSHFSAEEAEQLIERLHGELARQSDDRLKLDVAFGYHTVTEGPFDLYRSLPCCRPGYVPEQAQKPLIIRTKNSLSPISKG